MNKTHSFITTLCIIRHGETDWNSSGRLQGCEDTELNDAGREQAGRLAGYFAREHWDCIITSPLKRASETAQIIGGNLSLQNIQIDPGLRERDYGSASGLLPEERHKRFPDGVIPDQEEFEHLRSRAVATLNDIVERNRGKRVIVVSHGAFTNSILYTISNGEFGSFKTRLKNGCINKIIYSNDKWSVEFYNKTPDEL
jgi:uncharacterized phosphatase